MNTFTVTFLPSKKKIEVLSPRTVLEAAQMAGISVHAPCGGNGTCGKCKVMVDGQLVSGCKTYIDRDLTAHIMEDTPSHPCIALNPLVQESSFPADCASGYCIAFDIGTTTIVAYLLSGTGGILASAGALNPQGSYGADVISRIQYCLNKSSAPLVRCVRQTMEALIQQLCAEQSISHMQIRTICVAGNTAMHHLFLNIDPRPLITPPYSPAEKRPIEIASSNILSICPNATVRVLPNIAGFVGGDTVGCMIALGFDKLRTPALIIDIGTNGELVMTNGTKMIACSTAAGPAFEGAKISCGMRAAASSIDHVWLENGRINFSVIGNVPPLGICGSALLDAVAVYLEMGAISNCGRILTQTKTLPITESIYLTQNDISELQLAKAAIAAGIDMMLSSLRISVTDIQTVYLAGAFGSYMNPDSACSIGLIPKALRTKIVPVGNAAGIGSQLAALSRDAYRYAEKLSNSTEFLDLAAQEDFQDTYIDNLSFEENPYD